MATKTKKAKAKKVMLSDLKPKKDAKGGVTRRLVR